MFHYFMFGLNIIIALQNQSIKAWPLGMASREVKGGREGRVGRGGDFGEGTQLAGQGGGGQRRRG